MIRMKSNPNHHRGKKHCEDIQLTNTKFELYDRLLRVVPYLVREGPNGGHEGAREAEVRDLQGAVSRNQDVLRFQISVGGGRASLP